MVIVRHILTTHINYSGCLIPNVASHTKDETKVANATLLLLSTKKGGLSATACTESRHYHKAMEAAHVMMLFID